MLLYLTLIPKIQNFVGASQKIIKFTVMEVKTLSIFTLFLAVACNQPEKEPIISGTYDSYMYMNDSSGINYDSIMSHRMGVPVYQFGEKIFDEENQILYFSGYLNFHYPDKQSKKTGNYVYSLEEGIIVNSYVDSEKSERRVEDGDNPKTYVNGVGRKFGVRLYTEYDDEVKNKIAILLMDTSAQNISLRVTEDKEALSSIELNKENIIMSAGIPEYAVTQDASKDKSLPSGALFRVDNGDGTSQLHIKN
jgi:hypothetical protein